MTSERAFDRLRAFWRALDDPGWLVVLYLRFVMWLHRIGAA